MIKAKIFFLIKVISTILITSALGLESWNIYLHLTNASLPTQLNSVFLVVNIVLITHVIEGIIAALNANLRQENPLKYGIYTFFVGFVGLQELFSESTFS